jgi:signal transduction histidine kinase
MLYEFVTTFRGAIIAKTRDKVRRRDWPPVSTDELEHGVPRFLTQLSETLRRESTATPFPVTEIGESAALHGRELLALGFTVSQVVHDYGDICQAITELAVQEHAPITTEEFHILNRSLDTAIAEAVTEHARITAASRATEEVERLGRVAHDIRDMVHTALFAFQALKRGTVAVNGSTAAVLGRSLSGLRDFADTTLSDVRMNANIARRERIQLPAFLGDIAVAGRLHAESRGLQFVVEPIDPGLALIGDPQLLNSAVMNLVNNACKFTTAGGRIVLSARVGEGRLLIDVEDECGGIPESKGDVFKPFAERRGTDRSGLGLGLAIARKAVRAHGGEIVVRNIAGKGCVFTIDVPLGAADAAAVRPS